MDIGKRNQQRLGFRKGALVSRRLVRKKRRESGGRARI